jgi:beta-mannosidase
MDVHVTSDLTEPWLGSLRWSLETLSGEVLKSGDETLSAAPLASTQVLALDFSDLISHDTCRSLVFISELWQESQRVALALETFVPDKHLTLADPELSVDVRQEGDYLLFTLLSQSLARFVELVLAGADVVFSDNFFDLPAGRPLTVTCALPEGWSLERARQALRVRSLYDSYAYDSYA